MNAQLAMFGAAPVDDTTLVGLAIRLPEPCPRCSGHDAVIGTGRGPHKASIMCVCGRHLGWMSTPTFHFLAETVRQFGRPSEDICVNRKPLTGEAESKVVLPATAMKG